jgi:N-acylneuraminate cytidylyltransferase
MKPLFIIPARGGSRGIPHKNIKLLAGKPLIAYSIAVALQLVGQERVIVTTDDEEIASVARSSGILHPHKRPAELASDTAGTREVMLDAMAEASRRGVEFDCVVLLQPTSPFRTAADVEACMAQYSEDIDMAVTVMEASCNPYYDCFERNAEGFLRVSKGDGLLSRRQDAPEALQLNGAVYVINPKSLAQQPIGAMMRRRPVLMPTERSIDLDTPRDWAVAEALAPTILQNGCDNKH